MTVAFGAADRFESGSGANEDAVAVWQRPGQTVVMRLDPVSQALEQPREPVLRFLGPRLQTARRWRWLQLREVLLPIHPV